MKEKLFANDISEEYLKWYYDTEVWKTTSYLGIPILKSVSDMWNYQEIIFERKPSMVVEFGTNCGGSAQFFSMVLQSVTPKSLVLTVDINHNNVYPLAWKNHHIEFMTCSSTDIRVRDRILKLRKRYKGPVFAIIDSDHTKQHVLGELRLLREVLRPGDYLIVEDTIIEHPVLPGWGEGPMEAIEQYLKEYPDDYEHDLKRERKFGFTFAPKGFYIRK